VRDRVRGGVQTDWRYRSLQAEPIQADPKDDKFLEVALNGRADVIITGNADLLGMHPWREAAILAPAEYVANRPPELEVKFLPPKL
jgi:predicted nucleic acid-binding protein